MSNELLTLGEIDVARTPAQRRILRGGLAAAIVLDALLLAVLIWHPRRAPVPVTMTTAGPISAYVNITQAPVATSAPRSAPKPKAVSLSPAPHAAEPQPTSNETSAAPDQSNADANAPQGGGGPVRLNPGQVTLIRRVEPIYPPIMLAAHSTGTVVLDAIIHADGTIGDVTIVQSSAAAFNRAAIDAVKQWRYSPPGFEAVVNVTVIFSIR
jgi:TonB family protein